jgi:hypothetical protein
MGGEIDGYASPGAVPISEAASASGTATTAVGWDEGRPIVALLAAAAAVLIALLGVRASMLGSEASAVWQQAVRNEVKRAAATVEDLRYLYETEAVATLEVVRATVVAEEYRRAADLAQGAVKEALLAEAARADQLVTFYRAGSPIASDPKYALDGGGYSIVGRLVDLRAANPDLVAIDPDGMEQVGDRLAAKATVAIASAIPASFTFLFAALANAFRARRRPLMAAGVVTLLVSVVAAVAAEASVL